MTISAVDFPTWFSIGSYGGLACCMFAIAANALYTSLRRRGTTRQLAGAIVTCVISALLLLPAIVWLNVRFINQQAALSLAEIEVALGYVALFGWLLPLGVTATYWLFTLPRNTATSFRLPSQKVPRDAKGRASHRHTEAQSIVGAGASRHLSGAPVPFVYSEDAPWGWLEYRSGSFQGQRLALKRALITMGRDEDNDIWLDDEMASRHHAELSWEQGEISITDCNSLNGVRVNGKRIRGSVLVKNDDLLEVATQRFLFVLAEKQESPSEASDPLAHHTWRSSLDSLSGQLPTTQLLEPDRQESSVFASTPPETSLGGILEPAPQVAFSQNASKGSSTLPGIEMGESQDTELPSGSGKATPLPPSLHQSAMVVVRNGIMAGLTFPLDRSQVTVGRGTESDVVIQDSSLSRQHVQFSRHADGDYVHDLSSRQGTTLNEAPLRGPCLLKAGDILRIGNIILEYTAASVARAVPVEDLAAGRPYSPSPFNGPAPLRLPSRMPKEQ